MLSYCFVYLSHCFIYIPFMLRYSFYDSFTLCMFCFLSGVWCVCVLFLLMYIVAFFYLCIVYGPVPWGENPIAVNKYHVSYHI
jgi:hypothetical protein